MQCTNEQIELPMSNCTLQFTNIFSKALVACCLWCSLGLFWEYFPDSCVNRTKTKTSDQDKDQGLFFPGLYSTKIHSLLLD